MNSIVYIFIMLIYFVYIILCFIMYMMADDYKEKRFNKKTAKLSQTFGKEVLNHLNKLKRHMDLSYDDISYVNTKLNRRAYERVFNNTIIEFNQDPENHVFVNKYMGYYEDYIQSLIRKYSREDGIRKVYIAFLMGQYKVDKDFINNFLLDSIKTNSLYLRFNALNSIGEIGNVKCFIEALSYMSQSGGYFNNKVLIDIMDRFRGDLEEFDNQLLKYIDQFNDEIKCIIIEHFKNSHNMLVASKLAEKLNSFDTDKEVKASIIKYFSIIKYPPARQILINLLDSQEWECRALAAKSLSKYYSIDTVEKLLNSITDINWYVRLNSAMSLLDYDLGEVLTHKVLEKDDKYAREILFYAMFVKNKLTYQEYIEETNSQVAVTKC